MQDGNTTYLHKKRAYIIINHLLVGLVHQLFFLFFLRRGSVRLGKLEEEERVGCAEDDDAWAGTKAQPDRLDIGIHDALSVPSYKSLLASAN